MSTSHGPSIDHTLSLKRDAANQVIVIREELRCWDVGISFVVKHNSSIANSIFLIKASMLQPELPKLPLFGCSAFKKGKVKDFLWFIRKLKMASWVSQDVYCLVIEVYCVCAIYGYRRAIRTPTTDGGQVWCDDSHAHNMNVTVIDCVNKWDLPISMITKLSLYKHQGMQINHQQVWISESKQQIIMDNGWYWWIFMANPY